MKCVSLINGTIFYVDSFEKITNRSHPYYQNGRKYALCPSCGSSVQIIGGKNNLTQHSTSNIYAAHTKSEVYGLNFNEEAKQSCLNYVGNDYNWQKIYKVNRNLAENKKVLAFIENNLDKIAQETEELLGFKCKYLKRRSKLFENIYQSFKDNGGLRIASDQFVPEYISRLIVLRANPVNCWGAIPFEKTLEYIVKNDKFSGAVDGGSFKPTMDVKLVGTLDNDVNPRYLEIKLISDEGILNIKKAPAKVPKSL